MQSDLVNGRQGKADEACGAVWRTAGTAMVVAGISARANRRCDVGRASGICATLGAKLYFAAFLPGLFVLALVAGVPSAALAALVTVPLVWWAFMPPFFEFNSLTSANADSINLFCLLAVLVIGLADLCRATMAMVGRGGLKHPGESAALNPQ
ncbi:DUF4118 domain-containing protein [Bradyrhizobium sp. DOA1]|uniref:DUF4118 domain-containing protein n=1 Tax=Bradyrhizobium sp. DOA1 TaxID=1126616 RepID=UPI001FDA66F6|nr:DUF4118 domain-containing protein [Bradyrhizobium sp. DOA1]